MHVTFRDDGLGVLAALSLGDKRALSNELRTIYSDAGASHVLALSGLHIGVIYAILAFVMRGAVPSRRLRWLRELLIIVILWLFALLVGMPASVIRAVSMCTLYTLAHWISHDSSPLHTLTLSALIMLMVRPLYLFDVGFQLSFMSMAAILILSPYVEQFTTCHTLPRIPAYFVGIIGMSIAGLVLLIAKSRQLIWKEAATPLPKGTAAKTVYLNVGMVLYVLLCVASFVLALL